MFTELCSPWTGWPSLEGPLCLWHTWHCHIWFLGGNPQNGCYPKNSLAFGSFNILILPSLSFPLSTTSWHVDLVNGAGSPCKLGLPVIWSLLLVQVGQARRPDWAPPGPTLHHPSLATHSSHHGGSHQPPRPTLNTIKDQQNPGIHIQATHTWPFFCFYLSDDFPSCRYTVQKVIQG